MQLRVLVESGINPHIIEATGLGETQLIVKDCRAKYATNASARKQCDQPNRRVEIILEGQKKVVITK